MYILDLHGNSLKKETAPDGGKDENVFDIRQGVAIALFVRNKKQKKTQVYHSDLYGLRNAKYKWLVRNTFSKRKYKKIQPKTPYYLLVKRDVGDIQRYLKWKKINEIFPVNSVGVVTSRDQFAISFDKSDLKNKILQFKNLSQPDEIILQTYKLKNKANWNIKDARESVRNLDEYNSYIQNILYRPFDKRYIFYHQSLIERMRYEIMQHKLKNNLSLTIGRQGHVVGLEHL